MFENLNLFLLFFLSNSFVLFNYFSLDSIVNFRLKRDIVSTFLVILFVLFFSSNITFALHLYLHGNLKFFFIFLFTVLNVLLFYILNSLKDVVFLNAKSSRIESMIFSFFNYALACEFFYGSYTYLQMILVVLASVLNFLMVSFLVNKISIEITFKKIPKVLKGDFIIIIIIAIFSFILSTLNLIFLSKYFK